MNMVRELERYRERPAACRRCGQVELVWMFGCCESCGRSGRTRELVLAEIRASLGIRPTVKTKEAKS